MIGRITMTMRMPILVRAFVLRSVNLSADSEVSDDFFPVYSEDFDLTVWIHSLSRVFGVGPVSYATFWIISII